jgi:hypothetical protein
LRRGSADARRSRSARARWRPACGRAAPAPARWRRGVRAARLASRSTGAPPGASASAAASPSGWTSSGAAPPAAPGHRHPARARGDRHRVGRRFRGGDRRRRVGF